jgi:hypothetical protein
VSPPLPLSPQTPAISTPITLKEAGVDTQAEIVSALQRGQMRDARPIFNVVLRITPADAGEPFEVRWTTQTGYEPGGALAVRYDPEDHSKMLMAVLVVEL